MKLNRRSFIVGLMSAAGAVSVPLATLTSETVIAGEVIADKEAAAFLQSVMSRWDQLTQYYSWENVNRFLIPEITTLANYPNYFYYDGDFLVANFQIKDQWYTLRLEHQYEFLKHPEVNVEPNANVQKTEKYLTRVRGFTQYEEETFEQFKTRINADDPEFGSSTVWGHHQTFHDWNGHTAGQDTSVYVKPKHQRLVDDAMNEIYAEMAKITKK